MPSMAGYTKLFSSILASTIWRADDKTRLVWITMLAMSNREGVVEASIPGLADFAHVTLPECEDALKNLSSPDTYSRTKTNGGRRIKEVDGGWLLLNHGKYRETMSREERKEYNRVKQRETRARRAAVSNVSNVKDKSAESAHTAPAPDPKARERKSAAARPSLSDPFTDPETTERAGRFIERYQGLYQEYRKGARYAVRPTRDYAAAVTLCQTWPDERLEKLAICFLTTDHKFADEGSRTIPQFLALASWADGELVKWESRHAR
jgi:hypothetical protein